MREPSQTRAASSRSFLTFYLVGDTGIGKTVLFDRMVGKPVGTKVEATIGKSFEIFTYSYGCASYRITLWDTTGNKQKRFTFFPPQRPIIPLGSPTSDTSSKREGIVSGSVDVVFLVYSPSKEGSLEFLVSDLEVIRKEISPPPLFLLVGHAAIPKSPVLITQEQAEDFVCEHKLAGHLVINQTNVMQYLMPYTFHCLEVGERILPHTLPTIAESSPDLVVEEVTPPPTCTSKKIGTIVSFAIGGVITVVGGILLLSNPVGHIILGIGVSILIVSLLVSLVDKAIKKFRSDEHVVDEKSSHTRSFCH